MKNITSSICVEYKYREGWHIFTSEEVFGLYVASKDQELAYNDVATSIQLLLELNEGIKCDVHPELTFKEFLKVARTKPSQSKATKKQTAPRSLSSARYALHMAA